MRFGITQNEKFKSCHGAYSVVTPTEVKDSQITVTDFEAELIVSFFGPDGIHTGNVESNPALSAKTFTLYPSGKEIRLNLVFPKPGKNELRLYISTKAGFKPAAGDIWFMFLKDNRLWIGSTDIVTWRLETMELWEDESESVYQQAIGENDRIRIKHLRERDIHSRDRKIALKRLELANYTCEYDSKHKLFISRFSGRPHLEVHHLIPMKAHSYFKKPLDTLGNVCCLCPWCHSAVHYAEDRLSVKILSKLIAQQPVLQIYSLDDANDILGLYGVEKIYR